MVSKIAKFVLVKIPNRKCDNSQRIPMTMIERVFFVWGAEKFVEILATRQFRRSFKFLDLHFIIGCLPRTEKYFPNLGKSNGNQIVFTMHLDWFGSVNGHYPFAVPNQSESVNYNPNSVWINAIEKRFQAGRTTHRELFSKPYQIKSKSDCIYHAPRLIWNSKRRTLSACSSK